ncbi:hypothetical protein Q5705_08000 [Kosakonia sp. H02]|nr:hypothetical protein Q5705_08000 [Kosakonia sp. H02]
MDELVSFFADMLKKSLVLISKAPSGVILSVAIKNNSHYRLPRLFHLSAGAVETALLMHRENG